MRTQLFSCLVYLVFTTDGYEDNSSAHQVSFDFAGVEHHLSRTGTGDEVVVSVADSGESLCSNFPGAWRTLYRGKRCVEDPNQIEWQSVKTIDIFGNVVDAAKNWPCEWSRETFQDNEEWLREFMGSCGVSPTYGNLNETLPTEVYTFKIRNQEEDLCWDQSETTITTLYEGFPCGKDKSKMMWNSLRTLDNPHVSCTWLREGPGLHGATDPGWIRKYLGSGCGDAPEAFEGVLPTDSATVIATSRRAKANAVPDDEWARQRRLGELEKKAEGSYAISKAIHSFLAAMTGTDDDDQHRSLGVSGKLNLTQPQDPCQPEWLVNKLSVAIMLLIPDELGMFTQAKNLDNLIPCNDLPLTRVRDDGTVPVFGYLALYSYLVDIIRGVIGIFEFMGDTITCLGGGKPRLGKSPLEQSLDIIVPTLLGGGEPGSPKLDFIPLKWKDPNNCVDHQSGVINEKCSNSKPCCSYDFGSNAEFHPKCDLDTSSFFHGSCGDFSNQVASCYKNGGTCKTGADCCQKQTNMVICKKNNVNDATGICADAPPQPFGWNPFCLAYSKGAFAFTFARPFPPLKLDPTGKLGELFPNAPGYSEKLGIAFPPPETNPNICELADGFRALQGKFTLTVKIRGFGIGWSQDLAYGTNFATNGAEYGHTVPNVWDGYLSVPLPPNPGVDAWFAFRITILPTPLHQVHVASCKANIDHALGPVKIR